MPNETTLGDASKAFLKSHNLGPRLREVQAEQIWADTMGPTIQSLTRKIELRGDELTVHVDSAPLRQELSFGRDNILRLMNERLGGDFVKIVNIR